MLVCDHACPRVFLSFSRLLAGLSGGINGKSVMKDDESSNDELGLNDVTMGMSLRSNDAAGVKSTTKDANSCNDDS